MTERGLVQMKVCFVFDFWPFSLNWLTYFTSIGLLEFVLFENFIYLNRNQDLGMFTAASNYW